jgi:uncharacterized protein HemY
MRQGKTEQGIAAGLEGVKRQPDHVQALYFLGTAYTGIAEKDRRNCHLSAHYVAQAIRVEPHWMPSWLVLGGLALQAGQYEEAEKLINCALALERSGKFIAVNAAEEGAVTQLDRARRFSLEVYDFLAFQFGITYAGRRRVTALDACVARRRNLAAHGTYQG